MAPVSRTSNNCAKIDSPTFPTNSTMHEHPVQRYIAGGVARFGAGCELERLDLSASVPLTDKVSIKADANSILISYSYRRYNPKVLESDLLSLKNPFRYFVRATDMQSKRWGARSSAGFYQPEYAHRALEWIRKKPRMSGTLIYTVYITAPKEISDIVKPVIEIVTKDKDVESYWQKPSEDGTVVLRLTGVQRDVVAEMKREAESIYSGRVVKDTDHPAKRAYGFICPFEAWHDFFATSEGEEWLQTFSLENDYLVLSDKKQQRIRIYGQEHRRSLVVTLEQRIAKKIDEVKKAQESHAIGLSAWFDAVVRDDTLARAQALIGNSKASSDSGSRSIVLRCSAREAQSVASQLNLPIPEDKTPIKVFCKDCKEVRPLMRLSTCKQIVCIEHLGQMLKAAATGFTRERFPIVCPIDIEHECRKTPLAIAELRQYAPRAELDFLMEASLHHYVRSNPDRYAMCRTPGCTAVYRHDDSYTIITCPTCLVQVCAKCQGDPHDGLACEENFKQRRESQHYTSWVPSSVGRGKGKARALVQAAKEKEMDDKKYDAKKEEKIGEVNHCNSDKPGPPDFLSRMAEMWVTAFEPPHPTPTLALARADGHESRDEEKEDEQPKERNLLEWVRWDELPISRGPRRCNSASKLDQKNQEIDVSPQNANIDGYDSD